MGHRRGSASRITSASSSRTGTWAWSSCSASTSGAGARNTTACWSGFRRGWYVMGSWIGSRDDVIERTHHHCQRPKQFARGSPSLKSRPKKLPNGRHTGAPVWRSWSSATRRPGSQSKLVPSALGHEWPDLTIPARYACSWHCRVCRPKDRKNTPAAAGKASRRLGAKLAPK